MMDTEATDPGPLRRSTDLPPDAPWWARWFVANIREAWRWASVRWGAGVAIVAEVYAQDPAGVQKFVEGFVPNSWWPHIIAGGSALAVILRVINLKGNQP